MAELARVQAERKAQLEARREVEAAATRLGKERQERERSERRARSRQAEEQRQAEEATRVAAGDDCRRRLQAAREHVVTRGRMLAQEREDRERQQALQAA